MAPPAMPSATPSALSAFPAMQFAPSGGYFRCIQCAAVRPQSGVGEDADFCDKCSSTGAGDANLKTWCIIGNHRVDCADLFGKDTDFVTCCSDCRPCGQVSFRCGNCSLMRPIQLAIRLFDVLFLNNRARLQAGQFPERQATAHDISHAALDENGLQTCLYCAYPDWMGSDIERICHCVVGEHQITEHDRCLERSADCTIPEDIPLGDFCIQCSITGPRLIRLADAMDLAANRTQYSGVDIGALLHVRGPTVMDTDVVKRHFEANPEQQEAFDNVINSRQPSFNASQNQAAQRVTRSSTGLELIVGPPGTGKTDLGQAIVEGLAQCNLKVLVCSSGHEAVDVAFRKFQAITRLPISQYFRWIDETSPNLQISRNNVSSSASAEDSQNLDSLSSTSTNPENHRYHAKLHDWVQKVAQQPANPVFETATTYLETPGSLVSSGLSHNDRMNLAAAARNLREGDLAKAYLNSEVRVVFTTNAASCSGTLCKFFRPQVVFVEEAGSATTQGLAVPLASYMQSTKLVVLTGDPKQLQPNRPSANVDESAEVSSRSHFEILLKEYKADHAMLMTSYRMTGELGGWINSEFYDHKINFQGAPNPPLDASMKAILAPLKKAQVWNGRRRMAIDVSTRADEQLAVYSSPSPGTLSHCNDMEATLIVEFIHWALTHPIDESQGQQKILPKDMLIISPYVAQIQLIGKKLLEKRIPGLKVSDLRLKTTSQAQGSEASIVLVSLVRTNPFRPLDIGFIKRSDLLNVAMSRAKHWLLVLGNFQNWMREYYNRKSPLNWKKGSFRTFHQLLRNLEIKRDWVTGPHLLAAVTGGAIRGPKFLGLFQDVKSSIKTRASRGYAAQQARFRVSKSYRARGGRGSRGGRGGLRGRGGRGGRGGSGGEASSVA